MIFVTLNLFLCFSFLIKAANDDYLVIKSRTEQQNENYYRVPHGLRQIEKDYTHHEVSPGVWHRIDKNSCFVIDSWSDDQNTFSIEFFPLLQKHKLAKDGFDHTSFLLPKEQIQAFKVVLCPLSKGLFKKSIIAGLYFNKKDGSEEFYKKTVEKDVLQSEYWNQAIVESIQYLDSIKCSNDAATNAFRILDFLKSSFAIKQVLINYLYDKDLIDDVIEGDNETKKDFLKKYLLTNHLFHIVNRYEKFPTFYNLSCKELRFFNCENITLPKKLKSEDIELPKNIFIKTYTIKFSGNKIKDIDIADIIQSFDSRLKIIFDFRNNPLNNKTKQNIKASLMKRYPKKLIRAQNKMDNSFLPSEEYISNEALIGRFEQSMKDLSVNFDTLLLEICKLQKRHTSQKSVKTKLLSNQKFIKLCTIVSGLLSLGFLLCDRRFIFIIPFYMGFFVKKFIDIGRLLKAINIDYKKDSFDLKQKICQFNEIFKIGNNIKNPLEKIKNRQKQIKINQELRNNHKNKKKEKSHNCEFEYDSYLLNDFFYILFDK